MIYDRIMKRYLVTLLVGIINTKVFKIKQNIISKFYFYTEKRFK